MQKIIFLFFLFVLLKGYSQECYVKLSNTQDINYQVELEQAACDLIQSLPTNLRDSFKIFDFEFYLHTLFFQGNGQVEWDYLIDFIQKQSPYYLIFGRENKFDELNFEFKIEFNFPDEQGFDCLNSNSELVKNLLEIKIKKEDNSFKKEIAIMNLFNYLIEDLTNEPCVFDLSENDIEDFFLLNDFDSLHLEIFSIEVQKPNKNSSQLRVENFNNKTIFSDANANYSFLYRGISHDVIPELSGKIQNLEDSMSLSAFITDDRIFMNNEQQNYEVINVLNSFQNDSSNVKIWIHFCQKEGLDIMFFKLISNTLSVENNPEFDPGVLDDRNDYGVNILGQGHQYSCFSLNEYVAYNIINSLNAIFKHKYDLNFNSFKMEHLSSIPLVVKNPKYTWLSSWWTGETKYMTKNTSIYRIENENLFDWNTDKYTKALFDILNTNRNILVDFKSRNLNFYHTATLGDVKGWTGKSCCRGFVYLSQHLLENNEITGWNKGGTFMHEVLAHIHYLGNIETAHQMQLFYNFETSSIDHAGSPAMEWTEAEKSRLNNLRALTGH